MFDQDTILLLKIVLGLLIFASLIGLGLKKFSTNEKLEPVIDNLNSRTKAWWMMCIIFALALATGGIGSVILFGITSFLALREFITITPSKKADHKTLFWVFFIITPIQYYLIYIDWYGLFSIFIPVYAFLYIPARSALSGDSENFLERTAKIQWGLMISVYCISHAPALLTLKIPNYDNPAKLLFYLVLIVQLSDVFQYVFGKLFGRHKIAPKVSPNKTWEGFIGGVTSAVIVGTFFYWATPFSMLEAAGMSLIITLLGFLGGLTMSSIKRDQGIKDFGTMIEGHGGILDRMDSICFSAPIYFHLVRYFYS